MQLLSGIYSTGINNRIASFDFLSTSPIIAAVCYYLADQASYYFNIAYRNYINPQMQVFTIIIDFLGAQNKTIWLIPMQAKHEL